MDYLLNIAAEVIKFPKTDDEKESAANNFSEVKFINIIMHYYTYYYTYMQL